jgi:hypothetical protein
MSVYGCTLGLCARTCGLYTHESNLGGSRMGAGAVRMYRICFDGNRGGSRGGLVSVQGLDDLGTPATMTGGWRS